MPKSTIKYDLIIFDCDGTLVDSEWLNNKAFSDILMGYGLKKYTPEYALAHFVGLTVSKIMLMIQMETGFVFPDDTVTRYVRRVEELQQVELHPVTGALEAVQQAADQGVRICVGSNGERSNVIRALELTGFKPYFDEAHIFTKIQVQNAKPAPDLFLFAAEKMGVSPERCVVIEDSGAGVAAGVAAGMTVIGFTGSNHYPEKLKSALQGVGAHHIAPDFIHIKSLLGI